jgi:hypothetical protein
MTDWIKIGTGVAMMLPGAAFLFLIAWRDAKQDGMSFSEFAQVAIALVGGGLLLFGSAILAGAGGAMIVGAFQ